MVDRIDPEQLGSTVKGPQSAMPETRGNVRPKFAVTTHSRVQREREREREKPAFIDHWKQPLKTQL